MSSFKRSALFALIMIPIVVSAGIVSALIQSELGLSGDLSGNIIFYGIAYLLPMILYFLFTRERVSSALSLHAFSVRELVLSLLLALVLQPALMGIGSLSSLVFTNYVSISMSQAEALPLWQQLLAFAFIPAICEEFVCRGILLSGLRTKKALVGCLLSGLFFAIYHLNFQQGLYAFFFGTAMAGVVCATRSVWLSVLIHWIVNASQLFLWNLADALPWLMPDQSAFINGSVAWTCVVCVVSALLSIVLIFALRRREKR